MSHAESPLERGSVEQEAVALQPIITFSELLGKKSELIEGLKRAGYSPQPTRIIIGKTGEDPSCWIYLAVSMVVDLESKDWKKKWGIEVKSVVAKSGNLEILGLGITQEHCDPGDNIFLKLGYKAASDPSEAMFSMERHVVNGGKLDIGEWSYTIKKEEGLLVVVHRDFDTPVDSREREIVLEQFSELLEMGGSLLSPFFEQAPSP